jgi:monomeric isocitrate dehydrogenase
MTLFHAVVWTDHQSAQAVQLVALVRQYLLKHDNMTGTPVPHQP